MATATDPTTTDAYQDYVAVVVNGMSKADRAKERGISPSTIGANVKRATQSIDAGEWPDPRTGDGTTVVVGGKVDARAIADDMLPVIGPALVDSLAKVNEERARMRKRIDDLTTSLAALDGHEEKVTNAAASAGFDFEEWRTRVSDAETAAAAPQETPDPKSS